MAVPWHGGEQLGEPVRLQSDEEMSDREVVDDQPRGEAPVPGRHSVGHRVGDLAVRGQPVRRRPVQLRHEIRLGPAESALQG